MVWKRRNKAHRIIMKNLELNLGKACNNKCVFCVSGDSRPVTKRFIDLETIKKELDFFYKKGSRALGFLGGEPTIYPGILDAVRYAKKIGYKRIALTTNGTRLADNKFCIDLINAGVNRFTISIHSHKAEVEDRLTRVPGNFDKKIKGIKNLVRLKKKGFLKENVSLNAVIHAKNYKNLSNMVDFFSKLGIDDIRFNFIRPEGSATGDRRMVPTYQSVIPYFYRLILRNEKKYKINITIGEIPFCIFKEVYEKSPHIFTKYIGEFYDLSTEVSSARFDKDENSQKITCVQSRFNWQDKKRNFLKKKLSPCKKCRFLNVCGGVFVGYLKIYRGTKLFKSLV